MKRPRRLIFSVRGDLSRFVVLANLDGPHADHTGNRGHDPGVSQVQFRLIQGSFVPFYRGIGTPAAR